MSSGVRDRVKPVVADIKPRENAILVRDQVRPVAGGEAAREALQVGLDVAEVGGLEAVLVELVEVDLHQLA